ncbi:WhiB family transcriptional regulator [Nocardia sp. CDC160]|uniref:WhiB family transcriptional regulator n=1 Tax=Nocardia sp. CDC160 TaxID=3112166 RepID=UPI002DBF0DC0|nr:WhiB family transcriptional regulator [Nocardia sp. CDC160]MEC3920317.1 WhiB family transcriptional regulator [Nocardia sp. CDC160]
MPTVRSADPTIDDEPWQSFGSCRGMDSAVFFHPDGERGRARVARERRAKQICNRCPVMDQCRAYALATKQSYGIWGGMSEHDLQKLLYANTGSSPRLQRRRSSRLDL